MFWRFNVINTQIDNLLDKEDITLQEILEEDDVLQECKAQNPRLLDFLCKPENMDTLVNWVTTIPKDENEEAASHLPTITELDVQTIPDKMCTYKFPNIACELLTSDCPQITERLAGEEAYLTRIYSFLESEGTVNPLLASFFSKVMGLLIARKSELILDFLKSKEDCVSHLLRHIGTSAIMDLLLRLITCIEAPEIRLSCINWLNDQSIIQKLVGLIDAEHSEDKHCNASQSLCDIIRLSRDQMSQLQDRADPDPLLATIESTETISTLLDHMFRGDTKVESVLVNGLQVIQTLLDFRKAGYGPEGCQEMTALDRERLHQGVSNTVNAVIPRLADFQQVLLDPPKQYYHAMPTTVGLLDPPLGNTRLQIVRLIASILLNNSHDANVQLASHSILGVLLDLFFKYPLNNFLHTQAEACICTVLNSTRSSAVPMENCHDSPNSDNPLLEQLFSKLKLMERILEAWEDNEPNEAKPGRLRSGFMGHLTHIANHVNEQMEKGVNSERLKEIFSSLDEEIRKQWETFTANTLTDMNKRNTLQMVGGNALHSSSDSEDPDFSNIHFPQESAMQQAFSDYQLHQMTSTFIDQFGFKEDEFIDTEERTDAPFTDKISSINFDANVPESSGDAALFEQTCSERLQQFDDQDSDEDPWEDKERELTYSKFFGNSSANASAQRSSLGGSGGPAAQRRRVDASHDDEEGEERERRNSSDESTDSEDELSSPQKIYQTTDAGSAAEEGQTQKSATGGARGEAASTAENMDVSENFANFDNFPVAMETGNSNDDWAKFDAISSSSAKPSAGGQTEAWADFSRFEDIGSSETASSSKDAERSASPVAMDTDVETSSSSEGDRSAQYLVSGGGTEEGKEEEGAPTSSSVDVGSSVDVSSREEDVSMAPTSSQAAATEEPSSSSENNESSPPSSPRQAWSSGPDTPRPSDERPRFPTSTHSGPQSPQVPVSSATVDNNSTISSTSESSSEVTLSECEEHEASSSSQSNSNSTISSTANQVASDSISSSCKEPFSLSQSEPCEEGESSSGSGQQLPEAAAASVQSDRKQLDFEFDDDDELNDNFNFLSGLMGRGRKVVAGSADGAASSSTESSEVGGSAGAGAESSTQDSAVDSSSSVDPADEAVEEQGEQDAASKPAEDSEATAAEGVGQTNNKLEALRAEALNAMSEFEAAQSSSSSQNGPVG